MTDRIHYLACFPARPIPLQQGRTYSLGRADGNNIIVADADVSRNHAVVRWDQDKFVLVDLGSRNGCYVDRERVTLKDLEPEDRIKLGDRMFTYYYETPEAMERIYEDALIEGITGETEALQLDSVGAPQQGFAGALEDFGMPELLQTLELNNKTGVLTLVGEKDRGTITVQSGEVVAAQVGDITGQEAVYIILSFGRGFFEFDVVDVDVEREIKLPTAQLLMEALRRQDEMKRTHRKDAEPS